MINQSMSDLYDIEIFLAELSKKFKLNEVFFSRHSPFLVQETCMLSFLWLRNIAPFFAASAFKNFLVLFRLIKEQEGEGNTKRD